MTEKKRPLEAGDRIAVFGPVMRWDVDGFGCASDRRTGVVHSHIDGLIQFEDDEDRVRFLAHHKQCRRLVPKKRREWWIHVHTCSPARVTKFPPGRDWCCPNSGCTGETVHVREVKP